MMLEETAMLLQVILIEQEYFQCVSYNRIELPHGWKNMSRHPIAKIFLILLLTSYQVGCTNSFLGRLAGSVTILPSPTATSSTSAGDLFVISTASITASNSNSPNPTASGTPSSGAASAVTNIFFDTAKSTANISTHCNTATAGQTSKACLCQFTWAEVNPNSGSTVATNRNVITAATQVQPNVLTCNAPSVYSTEIISGTQIKITVLAAPGNPDAGTFTTTPYAYIKSPTTQTGSFQDAQGHIFDNIVHYSCYNKFLKGLNIQSKINQQTNSTTGDIANMLFATSFCLTAGGASAGSSSSSCPSLGAASNSAQSYYFNLFIRNSEKGDINKFNDTFVCPTVQEPLNASNSNIGNTGQFWPMDTTFALSLGATTDFSVGVQANTKLSGGSGDPTTASSQCFPTADGSGSSSGGNTTSIVSSCLGFAAQVSADGTCPFIKSASGQILQTFRLRRFVALYPRLFDTNGAPAPQAQATDTIYVLDRPIASSATINPLKPYTMLGPKPCPSAFFDKKNVTGVTAPLGYRATNDERWHTGDGTINYSRTWTKGMKTYDNGGTDVDGLEFPNFDGDTDTTGHSCSAAMPFLSSDGSRFYIATLNKFRKAGSSNPAKFNHLYIRPFKPFTPHYEEDTAFMACAPQANPFKDPPLHFMPSSTVGTNYAWCAESYPTQNPNITSLDPAVTPANPGNPTIPSGNVAPFTSHISVANGATPGILGADCAFTTKVFTPITIPTSSYTYPGSGAASGYANHSNATTWGISKADKTCDRTVVASTDVGWTQFPLLAPSADVETALKSDSSYNCTVTFDNATGKAAALQSPSGGCCSPANSPATKLTTGATHLEPSQTTCLPPAY
jgi:hypothetical protein